MFKSYTITMKKNIFQTLLLTISFSFLTPNILAKTSIWRKILHQIHFGIATEPGLVNHSINITNKKMFIRNDDIFILDDGDYYRTQFLYDNYLQQEGFSPMLTDLESKKENEMIIQGQELVFPISLHVHTDIGRRLRLGAKTIFSIHTIKKMNYQFLDKDDVTHKKNYYIKKIPTYNIGFLGKIGFILYNSLQYRWVLDYQGGISFAYRDLKKIHYKSQNNNYFNKYFVHQIGLTIEKRISSCVSLLLQPYYEFPFIGDKSPVEKSDAAIVLDYKKFGLSLGITIQPPLLPRCKKKYCQITKDHQHHRKAFRGLSIFQGKDKYGNFNYTQ